MEEEGGHEPPSAFRGSYLLMLSLFMLSSFILEADISIVPPAPEPSPDPCP